MNTNLTEEDTRRALFGLSEMPELMNLPRDQEEPPQIVFVTRQPQRNVEHFKRSLIS